MKLRGKVALITGAGSGIGRASALLFAHEGARIVVVDIVDADGAATVEAIRAEGAEAIFVRADVSNAEDAARMVQSTVEEFGRLDVLFNNAGVDHPEARSVTETSEALWDYTIDVNLKGVFLGCKYAIPTMIEQGGGVIINTASIAGLVGTPAEAAYCASKGGVVLLTKQMAIDYASDNIRVNCICPGALVEAVRDRREQLDETGRRRRADQARRYPLRRLAEYDEIARAALYLASDDSSFVTGTALVVDGGFIAQ